MEIKKTLRSLFLFIVLPFCIFLGYSIHLFSKEFNFKLLKNREIIGNIIDRISQANDSIYFNHSLKYIDGKEVRLDAVLTKEYYVKKIKYIAYDNNIIKYELTKEGLIIQYDQNKYILNNVDKIIPLGVIDYYMSSLIRGNKIYSYNKISCLNEVTKSIDTLIFRIRKNNDDFYEVYCELGDLIIFTLYNLDGEKVYSKLNNLEIERISFFNYIIPFNSNKKQNNISSNVEENDNKIKSNNKYNYLRIIRSDSVKVKMKVPLYYSRLISNHRQKIESLRNDTVQMIIYKKYKPFIENKIRPLNSSEHNIDINFHDSEIKNQAFNIIHSTLDFNEKIKLITFWCAKNIKYLNTNRIDALNVLKSREGECQGISNLCVSLLKAVNIPARVVAGIVLLPNGRFGYHNWVEILDNNQWLSIDPTWGQVPVDVSHIKIIDYYNNINFHTLSKLEVLDVQEL